jgi:hypothetical protein
VAPQDAGFRRWLAPVSGASHIFPRGAGTKPGRDSQLVVNLRWLCEGHHTTRLCLEPNIGESEAHTAETLASLPTGPQTEGHLDKGSFHAPEPPRAIPRYPRVVPILDRNDGMCSAPARDRRRRGPRRREAVCCPWNRHACECCRRDRAYGLASPLASTGTGFADIRNKWKAKPGAREQRRVHKRRQPRESLLWRRPRLMITTTLPRTVISPIANRMIGTRKELV